MNQGKIDIIAKRKVQALFRNKQKYKYDNHMQIMLVNINDQWQHQGGHFPPSEALPPTCPPVRRKKLAKISHFWQIFWFLPPQNHILPPRCPPQKKFLVPPLLMMSQFRGKGGVIIRVKCKSMYKLLNYNPPWYAIPTDLVTVTGVGYKY